MNARQAIRIGIDSATHISLGYLSDLTEDEFLVRPVPGANHIAWQLGHLIGSEHQMVELTCPGSMPALPAGFTEKYTPETAALDAKEAFHSKSVLMNAFEEQHSATLRALEKLTDADLDKPAPEPFREYAKTVGEVFAMQGTHWLMHAGQWAVVRRKLGRKPLF